MCLNIFEPSFFCEHCYCSLFIFAGTVISGAKLTTHVMKLTSVKEEKIKKEKLYKCPNSLIFHPSQFPGTIPRAAMGRIMLAEPGAKTVAIWEWVVEIPWTHPMSEFEKVFTLSNVALSECNYNFKKWSLLSYKHTLNLDWVNAKHTNIQKSIFVCMQSFTKEHCQLVKSTELLQSK